MALQSRDELIAAVSTRGFTGFFHKFVNVVSTATRSLSTWTMDGTMPGWPIAPPATPTACDAGTSGGLPVPTVTTPGNSLYLTSIGIHHPSLSLNVMVNTVMLDRAGHRGSLVANTAAAQTVNLSAPARLASTVGYLPYLEVHAVGQATSPVVWTVSYTNSDGVAGRTGTLQNNGMAHVGYHQAFTLQTGDVGVSHIASVTQTTGAGTLAGNIAVVLARPLLTNLGSGPNATGRRNFVQLLDLGTSPCLYFACTIGQGFTLAISGTYTVVEG